MSEIALTFDIGAGALCLDFINTLNDRASGAPREHVIDYAALLEFAAQAEVLAPERVAALRPAALRDPVEANALVARARDLREALYRVFDAFMAERVAEPADLAAVNGELRAALAHVWLEPEHNRFRLLVGETEPNLAEPLWVIARSAFELLLSPDVDRVRECANHECGWLFLDLSRNRSRKWCDMTTCGNRAKVRRFREREARP